MAERISFGIDRSRVFDHAYFVNNYGWFNGSETQIIANGDVRANGDMSLSGGPKINGNVYAARNDELRVPGQIKDGIGTMDSESAYKSKQYGVNDRARPLQEKTGDGGYDAPATVTTQTKNDRLHPEPNQTFGSGHSQQLEMPWISDLNQYVDYGCSADYGIYSTLSQGSTYYIDNRPSNRGGENYGYYTGTGPSGDPKLPDNHAIKLAQLDAQELHLHPALCPAVRMREERRRLVGRRRHRLSARGQEQVRRQLHRCRRRREGQGDEDGEIPLRNADRPLRTQDPEESLGRLRVRLLEGHHAQILRQRRPAERPARHRLDDHAHRRRPLQQPRHLRKRRRLHGQRLPRLPQRRHHLLGIALPELGLPALFGLAGIRRQPDPRRTGRGIRARGPAPAGSAQQLERHRRDGR